MAPRPPRRQGGRSPRVPPVRGRAVKSVRGQTELSYQPRIPRPPRPPQVPKPEMPAIRRASRGEALGIPEREKARRGADQATLEALEDARNGDDTSLLPYQPTPSINPPRPRTRAAGYDAATRTLRVRFRDGAVYGYYDVPPNVWRNFKRVKSPGKAINRTLNNYAYAREDL